MKNLSNKGSIKILLPYQNGTIVFIFTLVLLSVIGLNRNADGIWEITIGIREMTAVLAALILLPAILGFFRRYETGGVKLPGVELSWDRKKEIDEQVAKTQEEHYKAGEAAKNPERDFNKIENLQRNADNELLSEIAPEEFPIVQHIYLHDLHKLVKAFNRNRHLPFSNQRTYEGDKIAFRMRAIAPILFERIEVKKWIHSANWGKRLAAIKYLDWAQDIEYLEDLLERLLKEGNFTQYHIRLAISNMADQFTNEEHRELLESGLKEYNPPSGSSRESWVKLIISNLPQQSIHK